jgi:hypothetical protein
MITDSATNAAEPSYIEFVIQPRFGFTQRLLGLARAKSFHALIEGPYGSTIDFREFGTVVMFASGIGIASHLLYIKELVMEHRKMSTKTRDLLIIWTVDDDGQLDLIRDFMTGLLIVDKPKERSGLETSSDELNDGHRDEPEKDDSTNGCCPTPAHAGRRPAPSGENVRIVLGWMTCY